MASSAVTQWFTASTDRQHVRELATIDRGGELAEAQVDAIGRVQARALFASMQVNLLRREAERIAPDGAELYAMIAVAGAVEMANVITRMNRPGRR